MTPGRTLAKMPTFSVLRPSLGPNNPSTARPPLNSFGGALLRKKFPSPSSEKNELKLNTARVPRPKLLLSERCIPLMATPISKRGGWSLQSRQVLLEAACRATALTALRVATRMITRRHTFMLQFLFLLDPAGP